MNDQRHPGRPAFFGHGRPEEYLAAIADAAIMTAAQGYSAPSAHSNTALSQLKHDVNAVNFEEPLRTRSAVLDEIDDLYLEHAVWFHHGSYAAHLNCPVTTASLAASAIVSAVNSSLDTWDQSRAGTLIEQRLLKEVCGWIGFGEGSDGVFTPGGTTSNLQAMLLARGAATLKTSVSLDVLRVYTTANTHFSIAKALHVLGLPPSAVVTVPTLADGSMCAYSLTVAIAADCAAGLQPMAVIATAGTTDRGAIDPIADIAAVCEAYDVWLHVDAAIGGILLASDLTRPVLAGVSRASSVTLDFHKTFFVPVGCSALIVSDARHFAHSAWHADYLNPASSPLPNSVDKTLQTTRRFDALTLWASLRQHGAEAIVESFRECLRRAQWAYDEVDADPALEALEVPQLTMLLFRFTGDGLDPVSRTAVNRAIRDATLASGDVSVAATTLDGDYWLKLTLLNPETTRDDIQRVVAHVAALGNRFLPTTTERSAA